MTRLWSVAAVTIVVWSLTVVPAHASFCGSDGWGGRAAAIDPAGDRAAKVTAQTNLIHFGITSDHLSCQGDFYATAKLISGFGPNCQSYNKSTHHNVYGDGLNVTVDITCQNLHCGEYYNGGGIHTGFDTGEENSESSANVRFDCTRTPQEECEGPPPIGEWYNDMCNYYSPIVIPTNADQSYKLTSAIDGVSFDLDGDGVPEQVAWTPAGSRLAFLAIDRDADGRITSGRELFGNHTLPGVMNGFDALAQLMPHANEDCLDTNDGLFSRLLLWTDFNHNGVSESEELQPASAILARIGLGYITVQRRDGNGNVFRFKGWADLRLAGKAPIGDGPPQPRRMVVYDVILSLAK